MSGNIVRDWMTPKPITVSSSCPLRDAYWLMLEHKVRRLPVVDDGRLVGIVTLEDVRRAEPPTGICLDLVKITEMLSRMSVRQVMSDNPRIISPEVPLIEAARMMLKHKISTLPVIEGDELVGIITERDIFRAFVKLEERE